MTFASGVFSMLVIVSALGSTIYSAPLYWDKTSTMTVKGPLGEFVWCVVCFGVPGVYVTLAFFDDHLWEHLAGLAAFVIAVRFWKYFRQDADGDLGGSISEEASQERARREKFRGQLVFWLIGMPILLRIAWGALQVLLEHLHKR